MGSPTQGVILSGTHRGMECVLIARLPGSCLACSALSIYKQVSGSGSGAILGGIAGGAGSSAGSSASSGSGGGGEVPRTYGGSEYHNQPPPPPPPPRSQTPSSSPRLGKSFSLQHVLE